MATATTVMTERQARKAADELIETIATIKELEAKKTQLETDLRAYVEDTGEKTIGRILAYERTAPWSLTFNGRPEKEVLPILLERIHSDYITRKADVKAISEGWVSDADLRKALIGLKIEPTPGESKLYFKHV